MGRRPSTGRYETRQQLEMAIWSNHRMKLSDSAIARAVGASSTTVSNVLRNGQPPVEELLEDGLAFPHRTDDTRIVNANGEVIACAMSAPIAEIIANALNLNGYDG